VAASDPLDWIARFAIGWLATGKFLSSLAILFGIGAALIAARSLGAGESPRPLLARRYAGLMVFGIAHMLIFPGDILFLYGLTGLALLPFTRLRTRAILFWSAAIFAAYSVLDFRTLTVGAQDVSAPAGHNLSTYELLADALLAHTEGSFGEMVAAHASEALLLQRLQLSALPWVLALFLFGFAIARAGILNDLRAHRALLKRGAWIGLAVGLPANFALGFGGPLAGWGPVSAAEPAWLTRWTTFGLLVGEPLLAVGYLCTLSLFCLRRGALGPLVAVGRMALTAYLLQSALALAAFGGFRLYDRLSTASALLVVAGIWAVLLVACPLWLRWFQMGPVEWLWRSLTYGRVQPLRVRAAEVEKT
jgi:uncharacterized protein